MRPELKKTLTGNYVIKYDCPGCGDRLSSSLDDAGTRDTCPGCGASFDVPGVAEKEKLAARNQAQSEYKNKQREQERAERAAQDALRKQQKQEAATQRAKEVSASEVRQRNINLNQEALGYKYSFKEESYHSVVGILSELGMLVSVVACCFFAIGAFLSASVLPALFFVGYIVVICSVSVLTRVGWKIVVAQQATAKEASRTRAMIQDYLARQRDG